MELTIETAPNEHGGTDYKLRGDQGFYWWLVNSAGGARDGFLDIYAGSTDGKGDRVVLDPTCAAARRRPGLRSRRCPRPSASRW
jgi:hypothetical protein